MGLKEVLVNYQTEKLLLGFTVACVVLSALLPDIWPNSTRKDAPRFLNSAPRCVESLMDAVNVDMMEGHEPLPNKMHNPAFLGYVPGDARQYKFGESFDICEVRCMGIPSKFQIIRSDQDECTGETPPYYQGPMTCEMQHDNDADCNAGADKFYVPEVTMRYTSQTCEDSHPAQKKICASDEWFEFVFPSVENSGDKVPEMHAGSGFSFSTDCVDRVNSECVAYEVTPTYDYASNYVRKYGEDCIIITEPDTPQSITYLKQFGTIASSCSLRDAVPESWPYGSQPVGSYYEQDCFGKLFGTPNPFFTGEPNDISEDVGDDYYEQGDFTAILSDKSFKLATRRPPLSRVTTKPPEDDDKPRKTKAEKANLSPKTVGLVINLDEPVSHSLDAAIDSMDTKCDKYLGRARAHTKLTGKPFDIFDIDYFPELALCNAIYGFPPAEQCASVLDPENHHLLGSTTENGAESQEIRALEKALKTLTREDIEKAHKMCTNATRASCGRHYPQDGAAFIRKRAYTDMVTDASRPPLVFEGNENYDEDTTFEDALKFIDELKESPCIMKGMQGRSSINKGRFFRNLLYENGYSGVQNAPVSYLAATEGVLGNPIEPDGIFKVKFGIGSSNSNKRRRAHNSVLSEFFSPHSTYLTISKWSKKIYVSVDLDPKKPFYESDLADTQYRPWVKDAEDDLLTGDPEFFYLGSKPLSEVDFRYVYERFVQSIFFLAEQSAKIDREDDFYNKLPDTCFSSGTDVGMTDVFIKLYLFFVLTLLLLLFPRTLGQFWGRIRNNGDTLLIWYGNDDGDSVNNGGWDVEHFRAVWSRLIMVFGIFTGVLGIVCAMSLDPAINTDTNNTHMQWQDKVGTYDDGTSAALYETGTFDFLRDLASPHRSSYVHLTAEDRSNAYYWSIMSGVVAFLALFKIAARDRLLGDDNKYATVTGGWVSH